MIAVHVCGCRTRAPPAGSGARRRVGCARGATRSSTVAAAGLVRGVDCGLRRGGRPGLRPPRRRVGRSRAAHPRTAWTPRLSGQLALTRLRRARRGQRSGARRGRRLSPRRREPVAALPRPRGLRLPRVGRARGPPRPADALTRDPPLPVRRDLRRVGRLRARAQRESASRPGPPDSTAARGRRGGGPDRRRLGAVARAARGGVRRRGLRLERARRNGIASRDDTRAFYTQLATWQRPKDGSASSSFASMVAPSRSSTASSTTAPCSGSKRRRAGLRQRLAERRAT